MPMFRELNNITYWYFMFKQSFKIPRVFIKKVADVLNKNITHELEPFSSLISIFKLTVK